LVKGQHIRHVVFVGEVLPIRTSGTQDDPGPPRREHATEHPHLVPDDAVVAPADLDAIMVHLEKED
jgi:hypothetical protein